DRKDVRVARGLQRRQYYELVVAGWLKPPPPRPKFWGLFPPPPPQKISREEKSVGGAPTPPSKPLATRRKIRLGPAVVRRIFRASSASRFGSGGRMRSAASIRLIVMSFPGSSRS